jgi:uncharacterized LabA/DUF88 family protein
MSNMAFIDGQNLHLSTVKSDNPWRIDLVRFGIYLRSKYCVERAYYFIGYRDDLYKDLYEKVERAGYILVFKEHNPMMFSRKKGNVDSDIIFHSMKKLYKKENFDKIVLVSGDGDYKPLVDFLIEENKFCKILFPSRKNISSLFKNMKAEYFDILDEPDIQNKINKNTPQ